MVTHESRNGMAKTNSRNKAKKKTFLLKSIRPIIQALDGFAVRQHDTWIDFNA